MVAHAHPFAYRGRYILYYYCSITTGDKCSSSHQEVLPLARNLHGKLLFVLLLHRFWRDGGSNARYTEILRVILYLAK